jgi:hypothetical protein
MNGTIMRHLSLVILLAVVPIQPLIHDPLSSSRAHSATAQAADTSAKEAFEAAKELGTTEAWEAFLANFPSGFYADLARAYIKKLSAEAGGATTSSPSQARRPATPDAPLRPPAAGAATAQATANPNLGFDLADLPPTDPRRAAVLRGGRYMGFAEKFNRYYTDQAWKPSNVVYVSPNGRGNGASRDSPTSVRMAVQAVRPGTQIFFLRGKYQGCFEFTKERSGTHDDPIVLYGERNEDRSLGVTISCCSSGQEACFNFEYADYIAVDGFELVGGRFGVRAVGEGYAASQHSRGIAVLNCKSHDQDHDPFFSGQSDWAVWERNIAYGAREGDGHGIYLNNGGDWNIVRFNETYGNVASDFQINPGPSDTCKDVGIAYDDPQCDAYAGEGEGGQGASDYFLIDSNYFHHGSAGANFTSVRRSVIRNNVFGLHSGRHNVSFWQETDNPRLGSSDNKIVHNMFITTGRHAVQFINNSTRNEFANNILLGITITGGKVIANRSATLMEVDDTVDANVYRSNLYVSGKIDGRTPNAQEMVRTDFSPDWFARFPAALNRDPNDFKPTERAPFLGAGQLSPYAPSDRNGAVRSGKVGLGPIEGP